MKISVFGLGYVGCVSIGCLAKNGYEVTGVDVSDSKVGLINNGKATIVEKDIDEIILEQFNLKRIKATTNYISAVEDTDISIIAVGTPSSDKGHLDLSYIFKVASNIGKGLKNKSSFHIIAIRSTVMPGTVDKVASVIEKESGKTNSKDFAVLSNPEFLREGSAVKDYFNPPYTLIGSDHPVAAKILSSIYTKIQGEIYIVPVKTAEIIKYVNNTFHALKIGFANEVGNICKALDIDSIEVMKLFTLDKHLNISPYYLKPGFAFGGSCLPKDLKALSTLAHDLYLDTPIIQNIERSNDSQIKRAFEIIKKLNKKQIGFLGISFKEGTDDLRNSPSVILIETLLGKGFSINIYDKSVHYSNLSGRNKDYIDYHIPHLRHLLTNDLNKVIEQSEMLVISNFDTAIIDDITKTNDKIILDLVGLLKDEIKSKNYIGINW